MTDSSAKVTPKPFKKPLTTSSFIIVFCILGFGFAMGYWAGVVDQNTVAEGEVIHPSDVVFTNTEDKTKKNIDFSLFWRVWDLLSEKYVDRKDLDANKLFYGAINGMLAASGDPYTNFFSPEEQKAFKEEISGIFDGIGAEMALRDGVVTVVAPLEGMPAAAAGVRAGDKILKINGEATDALSLDEAVKKIRGPKDTEVTLTLYSDGDESPHEVTVKRGTILVKSVRVEDKGEDIALIRVSRFGDDTHKEFREAVLGLQQKEIKGIVLDLRNNPGGLLTEAVDLASYFLNPGTTVVLEEDASGTRAATTSVDKKLKIDVPVVILINEGSASASEILAGALREQKENVRIVGETSFGKGSVQELIPLTLETSVKITVARWLTPKGNQINKVGIAPDEKVELTREDFNQKKDPQYDKAKEVLKNLMQ
jgi:carboxyl-terminal processing protease